MKEKFTAHISKEDCVSFFNLCASLPSFMLKSKFERQTQNKYATTRDEEIHNKDLRNIQKYIEDNLGLTMEEAATIYYDVQGTTAPAMKYVRGNFLVPDHEFKNMTTYMLYLHEYYMAQATETDNFGFEVIIRSPHVFNYPEEEKFDVEWECLFQLYQKRDVDVQLLTLWTM